MHAPATLGSACLPFRPEGARLVVAPPAAVGAVHDGARGSRPRGSGRAASAMVPLGFGFALVTLLAAGPFSTVDEMLHRRWVLLLTPEWEPVLQHGLDRLASQAVCLPVLAVTAAVIAWRRRSWRPLLLAGAAEVAWLLVVGGTKALFARPAPVTGDPGFGDGGLATMGQLGVSYPSGHAAEALLIYGVAVHLVSRYTATPRPVVQMLKVLVGVLAVNAVLVSFWLGWHWVSDLAGGLLLGGWLLAAIVTVDRHLGSSAVEDPGLPARTPRLETATSAHP